MFNYEEKSLEDIIHKGVCDDCGSDKIALNDEDKYVCEKCGVIQKYQELGISTQPTRAYTKEEKKNRVGHETNNWFGCKTLIKEKDIKKLKKKWGYWRYLSRIQRSNISGIERNFKDSMPIMKETSNKLIIPKTIRDYAWRIYSEAVKKKLTRGRSLNGMIGASILMSCRIHDLVKPAEEIIEALQIRKEELKKSYKAIYLNVLEDLGIKRIPNYSAKAYTYYFLNKIGLSEDTGLIKNIINFEIRNKRRIEYFIGHGKDPRGIAAALIYGYYKDDENKKKTQKEVAEIAQVTEVTLRQRVKDIEEKGLQQIIS